VSDYPKAVAQGWFPVATARELGRQPLARQLMDRPIVVFRATDGPRVFVDRCPHRNMPLSCGRVTGGEIVCPYHGWRFGGDGRCSLTPGAEAPANHAAQPLPTVERAGLIWTTLARHGQEDFPALPHPVGAPGFDTFLWPVPASRAALLDAVENFLDPAHPHFLHQGIVRSGDVRHPVSVTVRAKGDRAEAIYAENARASGFMPRLLEGFRTASIGRVIAPAIGQIAFEGPAGLRLAITVFFTPEASDRVRPFAHFATPKGRAPALLKEALLRAFNAPVLAQDRAALSLQAENLARFGAPKYAIGPLDFLRPAIQALADGEILDQPERTVQVRL
jgi:phenylpropionate dioxygenase-like ring-hydroxylating dioxygenase large terminal subunit